MLLANDEPDYEGLLDKLKPGQIVPDLVRISDHPTSQRVCMRELAAGIVH